MTSQIKPVSSQYISHDIDSVYIPLIEKNMMGYHFYNSEFGVGCRSEFSYLSDYILDCGDHFDFNIYRIENNAYPNADIELYSIKNNYFQVIRKGKEYHPAHRSVITYEDAISRRILVGLDRNAKKLIFISGEVFKSSISQDFKLDIERPSTFLTFLEFKLFNYNLENIEFVKRKRNYLLFKANSKELTGEKFYIKVKTYHDDFETIQIKGEKSGWTERGTYRWTDEK
ncbi:MAG: hypothetical protein JST78_12020 [Bacteroidetes bacterium]|nr:hypothetical protein [Bacteroidota bacterium]